MPLRPIGISVHQIYNISTVGENDEMTRFWRQKVKGQGHRQRFPKTHFSVGGIRLPNTDQRFAVGDHLYMLVILIVVCYWVDRAGFYQLLTTR